MVSCERGVAFEEGEDGDCLAVNGRVCSRGFTGRKKEGEVDVALLLMGVVFWLWWAEIGVGWRCWWAWSRFGVIRGWIWLGFILG